MSTIYFDSDDTTGTKTIWDIERFHFFDRLQIWCSRSAHDELVESPTDRNVVRLSETFWKEVQEHPIPIGLSENSRTSLAALTCTCGSAGAVTITRASGISRYLVLTASAPNWELPTILGIATSVSASESG